MNYKLNKNLIIGFFVLASIFAINESFSFFKANNNSGQTDPDYIIKEREDIIGIWYSESDNNYKLEFFTSGVCIAYYENVILTTYSYTISNLTPQCGREVLVDPVEQQTSYLQLYDINNGGSKCFEINGVNSLFSLTALDNGNLLIMKK